MKAKRYLFIVMIFILALTAACGGGAETTAPVAEAPAEAPAEVPAESAPAEEPVEEAPAETSVDSDFPLPDDASNVMDIGNGALNFQTALSIPDVATFYRFAFPDYTEREILTIAEEGSLNLVFDGHESGQSVVIQGFPKDDGTVNVSIRLEAIN